MDEKEKEIKTSSRDVDGNLKLGLRREKVSMDTNVDLG